MRVEGSIAVSGRGARRPRAGAVALAAAVLVCLLATSCRTRRVLEVASDPPGALVRLDEEVIGRTPLELEFGHYGRRRLTMYLPGYRTWSRRIRPKPPWYSRFPLDFVTEVLIPLGLTHRYTYRAVLVEDTGREPESDAPMIEEYVARAIEVRGSVAEVVEDDPDETVEETLERVDE